MTAEDQDELRIARQAHQWLIKLKHEGPAAQAPCIAWLRESTKHVEAFLVGSALSKRLRELDPWRGIDVDALIREGNDRVVPLPVEHLKDADTSAPTGRERFGFPNTNRGGRWRATAAVLAAAVSSISLLAISSSQGAETYATQVGEQRHVKLTDGSFIFLNTDSEVRVRYTAAARNIQLVKGEALFTVEHDIARPFQVSTDTAVVKAVGTQFDVYRQSARTLIEVVNGAVDVFNDPQSAASISPPLALLKAGQRAGFDDKGLIDDKTTRNIQLAFNWQHRWLVFTDAPLAQIAAELNRYNRVQIVVEGQELRERPLTVDFSADDPQILFNYLHRKDGRVVYDHQGDKIVVRFRTDGP